MDSQQNSSKENSWSVKIPNQLNLVVNDINRNVAASQQTSNLPTPVTTPREHAQIMYKRSNKKQQQPNEKTKQQAGHSNFFTNTSLTKIKTRLPPFKQQTRNGGRKMSQTQCPTDRAKSRAQEQISNSHLPQHTLNYLQMVDEPGVDRVVSKFGGHHFLNKFRNPLERQTLYHSQVRSTIKDQQPDQSEQQNASFLEPLFDSVIVDEPRVSKTRNTSKRIRSFFTSGNNSVLAENAVNTVRQQTSERPQRNFKFQHSSTQNGTRVKRNSIFGSETVVNDGSPRAHESTIVAMQDSIESVINSTNKDQMEAITNNMDAHSKQKVRDFVYFNVSHHNYQPFFKETKIEQDQRKMQIMAKQLQTMEHNSVFSHPSQLHSDSLVQKKKTSLEPISAVISSALRVRNRNSIGTRNSSLASRTGNPKPIKDGFSSWHKQSISVPPQNKVVVNAALTTAQQPGTAEETTEQLQQTQTSQHTQSQTGAEMLQKDCQQRDRTNNSLANTMPANLFQSGMTNPAARSIATSPPPLQDLDHSTDMQLYEAKAALLETTTQLLPSTHHSRPESIEPHYNDHALSLRQSQSASMHEASMLNLPMDGKILAECQTPSNQMHKGKAIEMMANTLTKQNESATQPRNSKVQTGSTQKEQLVHDKNKKLVSGCMTMKVSSESSPNRIEIKHQTDNDYTQQSHLDRNLRTKKVVPRLNTLGIQSDQLSVQNLIKINIGSEQSEQKTEAKEDVTPTNNNENLHLAIIEQPSAQVEIKESMILRVASIRQSSSRDPESNRQSNKDLEEFKLAGIISNQFSEANSGSVRQSIDAKMLAKDLNNPERPKGHDQSLDPVDEQRDTDNCEDLTTMSKYLSKDVEQKKDSIEHGVTEIGGDKNGDGVSPRMQVYMSTKQVIVNETKPDEPGDYVITQYSLPKALTAAGGTRPSKGKFNNNLQRRNATSQQRQYVFNANVKNASIDAESFAVNDSGNEELEQFNFEHGNKQMLTGPMGRKLSKPAASRFQHNLLRRKAIERQNFEQLQQQTLQQNKQQLGTKATQQSITQAAAGDQQSVLHHKASNFGQTQLESEMTIITIQGDPVKTFDRSTKDMHHQSMGRTNRSSTTKARHASTNMSQHMSRLSNDLKDILTSSQRISQQVDRPKVKVPQLQLNKVELQFAGQSKDHMFINSNNQFQPGTPSYYGNQMTANPPQSSFRLAVFAQQSHQFSPSGAENSRPHQTIGWNTQGNNQGMVNGGMLPRTTRMISIDVQTEAHRRELLMQSKLEMNVITQEKSVQDTLYEGNDHLHSQKWIQSGVQLVGAPEFKNHTADSKDVDYCQKQSHIISQTEVSQKNMQNQETSLPKQKESLEENDLVKIGDGAKTISQKALIDKMRLQVANTVRSSAEGDIKVVDTANLSPREEGHISVIQSHQTDQEKYLQTFRESLHTANDQEVSRRARRDTEELSPELSPVHKRLLENKYTPTGLEDTLAFSSKESSLQQVSTMMQHIKMTTRNNNRKISNQDLNIVVKTMPAQLTKDNQPELKNESNLPKDVSKNRRGSVHQEHDPMYLLDRQKIFSSNKEVNLEQIMKLRYSDDGESVEGQEKKPNSCDIQTDQQDSLKSNEPNQAVQNLMKKAIISYNSSEYVSLKLQNMVPGEDLEQNQPASTQISIDKTTVYQLQPKLPQVIAEMREQVIRSQQRRNSSQESRYNQNPINVRDSMCSQVSSTKSPLNRSSIHSMTKTRRASQSPIELDTFKDEDENWRKQCADKPKKIEKEWQKKYNDRIRKQRLLEERTKHLNAPKFGRDKTPLVSNNKMLQVPVQPHDRTKVSLMGRNNAKVEEVWAKKQLHNAAYNQN